MQQDHPFGSWNIIEKSLIFIPITILMIQKLWVEVLQIKFPLLKDLKFPLRNGFSIKKKNHTNIIFKSWTKGWYSHRKKKYGIFTNQRQYTFVIRVFYLCFYMKNKVRLSSLLCLILNMLKMEERKTAGERGSLILSGVGFLPENTIWGQATGNISFPFFSI